MRTSILSLTAIAGIVAFGTAWQASSVSAMASHFEPRTDPLAPFAVIDQRSLAPQVSSMVLVTSPNGGEVLEPGTRVTITWDSTDRALDFVNITYSLDDGVTSTTIANAVPNLGSYIWRVPDVYAAHAFIRVDATDLVDVLASDRSDADFVMNGARPTAPSPVTGALEVITEVTAGDFVQSPSFSTVYAIDGDGTRRPFELPGVIATYDVTDDDVVPVTDATLPTIPLGVPMLPKPGTVLVKFPDVRTVFAVEGSGSYAMLRAIHSEALASAIYGEEWKSYVWTLPAHYRNFYHSGSEIVTVFETDTTIIRRVDEITM